MKKKLVSALITLCLTATVMVGATLAYYSAQTDELVNTFTVGNVDITVTEPNWDPEEGEALVPGTKVEKDPMITNVGSSAGYMMLKIDGMEEMASMGFLAMTDNAEGYNTADWVLVDEQGNVRTDNPDNKLVDGYYVYIGKTNTEAETIPGTVEAGESTSALFTHIKLSEDAVERTNITYQVVGNIAVDSEGNVILSEETGKPVVKYTITGVAGQEFNSYEEAEAYVMKNHSEAAGFVFDLTVQGYAIQAENITFQTGNAYTWVAELVGATE